MATSQPPSSDGELLTTTIQALQRGLTAIPVSTAITYIDAWYQQLQGSGVPNMQDIARELGNLQSLISIGDQFDGTSIGRSLSMLGAQTIQAAAQASTHTQADLSALGDLLIKIGGELEAH